MRKRIMTALLLVTLAITGCQTNKSQTPSTPEDDPSEQGGFSFEQIDYELKPGVAKTDIKGAPWVNANLPGMVNKIEKPSLKDDFYSSINYEDLCANNPGTFDIGAQTLISQFSEAFDSSSGVGNSKFFNRAKDMIEQGFADEIHNYLTNININDYLHSKELFSTLHSFFQIQESNNEYYVSFVDGYVNGETNLATLSLGQYSVAKIKYTIMDQLCEAFDLDISKAEKNAVAGDFDATTCYTSASGYGSSNDWTNYTFGKQANLFLDDALTDYGLDADDTIYISKPTQSVLPCFEEYSESVVKNALIFRLAFQYRFFMGIDNYRPMSKEVYNTQWFTFENDLTEKSNEDALILMTKNAFPDASERSYLEVAGDSNTQDKISGIIETIINQYKVTAQTYDWLDDSTRSGLLRKLNNMKYYSCYSDKIKNYPLIDETNIDNLSLYQMFNRYSIWLNGVKTSGQYEDNIVWYYMPSYVANAYYVPSLNSFVILNGLLAGIPMDGEIEQILATIGMVIGHEISHSIDEYGSQFDEYGNYKDWWSDKTRKEFTKRLSKLKNFYNRITLYDYTRVNGELVSTEATADMGGFHIALEIGKTIDSFDFDLFFKSYAKLWLEKAYSDATIEKMKTNEHPYAYLRVNLTVSQFQEFFDTYDIKPGDRMYIPDEDRLAIW